LRTTSRDHFSPTTSRAPAIEQWRGWAIRETGVHHVAEGELFGMMRLMKPVAALLARSERARTVESLRRSLESD
jgi:hypothetical protein